LSIKDGKKKTRIVLSLPQKRKESCVKGNKHWEKTNKVDFKQTLNSITCGQTEVEQKPKLIEVTKIFFGFSSPVFQGFCEGFFYKNK
jgi:hypothetical protein